MSRLSKSEIKTWFRRNGFRLCYRDNWRIVIKYGCGTFRRNGRYYRLRGNGPGKTWVVDISEPTETFDRWANSSDTRDIPLEKFMMEYNK
jgi:hypothetical protein